jgi:hypothetical protein
VKHFEEQRATLEGTGNYHQNMGREEPLSGLVLSVVHLHEDNSEDGCGYPKPEVQTVLAGVFIRKMAFIIRVIVPTIF